MVCVLECGRCHIVAEPVIEKAIARGCDGVIGPRVHPISTLIFISTHGRAYEAWDGTRLRGLS